MREGIAAYFPEANGPTRRMVACMFTTSPDEHFILDRHPAMDDVFIAAGFSGHGYKFCSVIGRIMADFCLGEEEKWGVEGFGFGGGEVSGELRADVVRSWDARAALDATVDDLSETMVREHLWACSSTLLEGADARTIYRKGIILLDLVNRLLYEHAARDWFRWHRLARRARLWSLRIGPHVRMRAAVGTNPKPGTPHMWRMTVC